MIQVTEGPGDADQPTVGGDGDIVAFVADGSYGGGTGPGVGRRQVFVLKRSTNELTRVTDSPDGDSVSPSLSGGGGALAFESTASLLSPTTARQVYLYNRDSLTLTQLTFGEGDSSQPMMNKIGTRVVFQSTAALAGDQSDTGISQIFWYERSDGSLTQMTAGNGHSRNAYIEERTPGRVFFDSEANNLPGTLGSGGRQVYAMDIGLGATGAVAQLTVGVGNCFWPAVEPTGDRVVFICDGDKLSNGTTGNRLFALEIGTLGRALYQITGRGHVDGPIAANVGQWFVSAATDNDMSGHGICGKQLYLADYWPGHYYEAGHGRLAVSLPGQIPGEPFPGNPNLGCDDGNPCSVDTCSAGKTCGHAAAADGLVCGIGDICVGIPVCASGQCTRPAGLEGTCHDLDPCTRDQCDASVDGGCVYTPIPADQGGLTCRQVQLDAKPLASGRAQRMKERFENALAKISSAGKPKVRLRRAKKARQLADRFATVLAADSSVSTEQLQEMLDLLGEVVRLLQSLLSTLQANQGK